MRNALIGSLMVATVSLPASAAEYYCTYFGGVSSGGSASPQYVPDKPLDQLTRDGCKKGDGLRIVIYDHGSAGAKGREVMYLADEITQLCDLSRPVTIVGKVAPGNIEAGSHHAVCTYAGERRTTRRPN